MKPTDDPGEGTPKPDDGTWPERLDALGLADRRRVTALADRVGRPAKKSGRSGGGRRGKSQGGRRRDEPVGVDPTAAKVTRADVEAALVEAEARLERRRARAPKPTYPPELPITERHDELIEAIRDHQVVLVAGETGSGKSTQLPKLCLELGRGVTGLIGHTQPRRVAARTIAQRVADELGTDLGAAVGYTVRFNDHVGPDTYVKVMTDGILLAEMQKDRLLSRYDTLIIDEAHERSLNIDFLLGYLHQLLPRRPDLKVIITSATIDTARFAAHFGDAPVVEVSGRTFPVEMRYRPYGGLIAAGPADEGDDVIDDDRDQAEAICDAVDELAREGAGDILVFLSGEREIRDTAEALADRKRRDTEVLPLYARLSTAEQQRVFQPHRGRRVVLATNVAETSLTVPGVRYVVDAGTARISRYSHRLKVQRLPIEKVSQASANQRAGRCGRVAPGICIRLYAEDDFDARPEFTDPEIQRTNLASVILQMTNLGLGDVAAFPFLDRPEDRSIRDGIALLEELGALEPESAGNQKRPDQSPQRGRRLTAVGRQLVRLPIDPRLGRMVIESQHQGCVREVLIIASALSIQDPRERPNDQRQAADEQHRRFQVAGSDLLSLVSLWDHLDARRRELSSNRFRKEVMGEFLNHLRIREWRDLHRQLTQAAAPLGIRPGTEAAEADHVHRALLAGLLSQVGMRDRDTREFRGARGARFQIAPDSSLARTPPSWVMAAEVVETNRLWARGVAAIRPEWVEAAAAHLVKRSYGEPRWDERSGRAITDERVTLYGLPVVPARKVGYDRVDVAVARELFIDHALVRREWHTGHRFITANEEALDEAHSLGDKLRDPDLFGHDDTLFRFYDRRIGAEVVSGRHFDRWWKQTRRDRPDLLSLTVGDLLADRPGVALGDHPDTWTQGEIDLPLTYRFAPGEDLDGVTVHIPLAALDQVRPWDFDWQVPGYRRDLALALIATLPKALRRHLHPLAATSEAVVDALQVEPRELVEVLADALTAATDDGTPVRPSDLDLLSVPPHLRMTFAVHDDGEVIALGKDLEAVRALVAGRVRRAVAAATPDMERTGITHWDFGDIERVVRRPAAGVTVEAYPALVDEGDSVALRVFSRSEAADRAMTGGLRRLILLAVPVGVRALERTITDDVRRALLARPDIGLGALLRDVIGAAAHSVVVDHGGPTWTEAGWDALVGHARDEMRDRAERVLTDAGAVLVASAEVQPWFERLSAPSLAIAVADAQSQMERLVRPGFVASAGANRLGDVARYVAGIGVRLERLPEAPRRDESQMDTVRAVEAAYRRLLGALSPEQVTPAVVETGWLLEELRVGTFAQNLGTRVKVSPTRVLARIESHFEGNLD